MRWTWMMFLVAMVAATGPVRAATSMEGMSHGRYLGAPDLQLTSAMIAAGGGAHDFSSQRLASALLAQHRDAEVARLEQRFGSVRVRQYFTTFDAFVDGAIALAGPDHVQLPQPNPALARNSYVLAGSLRQAGVMPDGRFDVGYMIEHLLSRPMHKQLMDKADTDPAIGPACNADFHIILTAVMDDLKSLYHLPH